MNRTTGAKSYARIADVLTLPNLIEIQLDSFNWFVSEGLRDLFDEISPIESFDGSLKLYFPGHSEEAKQFKLDYWFEDPAFSQQECMERDLTYGRGLYINVALVNKRTNEHVVNDIFLGEFPWMTENGTFIYNGTERVVVSQLIRSPGVYFDLESDPASGRVLAQAKLIPDRGAWMEFETRKSDYITLKFNRKRTVPVTILLRALAAIKDETGVAVLQAGSDEEILDLFKDVDTNPDHPYILTTLRQEGALQPRERRTIAEEALLEFYRRMRPGDPPTLDNARSYLKDQLFDRRRYDLERVGRYKLNQRLGLQIPHPIRTVTKQDLIKLVEHMIRINNGLEAADDIDHLGNRRVKTVGELIQNKLRIGLRRMERVVKERMSIRDADQMTPVTLVNIRPVVAAIREFFGSSQLSQFMDQTNPLAELTHKRTLSALGPGGLRRERAGFDVRDVHHSHYGRICPIETPEGPNIGLIGRLATYGRVNPFGFIETPYRKVLRGLPHTDERLIGSAVRSDVTDPSTGEIVAPKDTRVTEDLFKRIAKLQLEEEIAIVPRVSDEIAYMSADTEDRFIIAQANALMNEHGEFVSPRISVRHYQGFATEPPERVDFMDVAPRQIVGISAALIPFLEHDDANRALMGSNMQRQAVPLLQPDVPIVATGMESQAALDSGQVVVAEEDGDVVGVTGREITIQTKKGRKVYTLRKYNRSNQSTCIDQRPIVHKGQKVKRGQVIADSSSTNSGELALGHNVLCAFISWEGGNYEDAILISERLVREDQFTSIHIEKHEVEARDTKLGPEEITHDIPNVGEDALKDLDENGIIRIGAEVGPNDILVGKITPKGEKELSPEEKLLRAIFGEKAREVKDSSLRLPHGEHGKVVDVKVFTRDEHRDLAAGVDKMVRVSVAQKRKLTEGDKMAGRHGNKGVISKVVPIEDMPFLEDGTPVDIILSPLGVPGRMNIGQILEVHLGWAANRLGFRAITPVFDGADESEIEGELARSWLVDRAWSDLARRAWEWLREQEVNTDELRDDTEAQLLYLTALVEERGYDVERLRFDETYARRAFLREWLIEQGHDPDQVLSFEGDARPHAERAASDRLAVQTCLQMWLADRGVNTDGLSLAQLEERASQVAVELGEPQPTVGKMILYHGKTGEPFDQPVTVGIIHMMKLAHLVEDKVHARSTGPYSLVTQQPLGGKAQFGGQRFGEMEVWALEAYGAAHTLQEMLTIKSDDVQGRVKAYESIVKGEPIEEPSVPASFRVLVKELQSLGLAVEAITEAGEVVKFGKEEEKQRTPRLGVGLMGFDDDYGGS
ncbi:MAG TPA: DNA-directed RNA polymerase subunit beta [Anaerolineae bacterium]|nr:DNA-directed RNA polymerase subunit beta [Anaerolineae bacterium]